MVETILRKSEGLFLYVESVRKELEAGRLSLERVEEFPQSLGGFYADSFRRYFPDPEEFASKWRPALEVICAAREPLELDDFSGLLGWPAEERVYKKKRLAKALSSLFPVSDGHIRPFHQSVREWLASDRAGSYFTSAEEGNRRLADYGWKQYLSGVGQMSRYSVAHLPAHLSTFPDRKQDLQRVLLDFNWMQAKLEATDITALIADYDVAPGFSPAGAVLKGGATQDPVSLLQGALGLSAHVLARDNTQLAGQRDTGDHLRHPASSYRQ